jgi:hypothetical protein
MNEINKYLEILQKIELDIKKEIEERKSLSKLYDLSIEYYEWTSLIQLDIS